MLNRPGSKPLLTRPALVVPIAVLFLLGTLIVIYVMTSGTDNVTIPRLQCLNPMVRTRRFEDKRFFAAYSLIQAHVHQRHMDRWAYEHSLIENRCWPKQLNSTAPPMPTQCSYDLSSVWETFSKSPDPYARPANGTCTAKQLTQQGIANAISLGQLLKRQYVVRHPIISANCTPGSIGLEMDKEQKNQLTAQHEYFGLCGRLPSIEEFPARSSIDNGKVQRGRPFWLSTSVCNNKKLLNMLQDSRTKMMNSTYWNEDLKDAALLVSHVTDHDNPESKDRATLLDNIVDCLVVHQCHNLTDFPEIFQDARELFLRMDTLETQSRTYPFDYFNYISEDKGQEFSSYYFGYYFKVLYDRMSKKISGDDDVKNLYIQVTSDSIMTPQLKMLGDTKFSSKRPPWGSTLVYELYKHDIEPERYVVRLLFNGHTLKICGNKGYCTWEEFGEKVTALFPEKEECEPFYNHYP